jgi:DNA polymerase-1
MAQVGMGEGNARPLTPFVVRTEAQLAEAVEHVRQWPVFTLDVETNGLHVMVNQITWIGLAVPDRVVLVPMGHPRGKLLTPAYTERRLPRESERKVLKSGRLSLAKKITPVPATYAEPGRQLRQDVVFEALQPLLFGSATKVGHNLKFDLESIAKYYGGRIPPGPYFDTLIMTHVLDENRTYRGQKYDLKSLVMDWLGLPKKAEVRKEFYPDLGKSLGEESLEAAAHYLAKDVWYTHLYRLAHIDKLRSRPKLWDTFQIEMDLYPVLMQMEQNGINIDTDTLEERGAALAQERDAIATKIWDICGEEFPVSNTNKRRHFLFAPKPHGQGLLPLSFTKKTNTAQINTETLEFYAPTNYLACLFLDWMDKEKIIGTFIEGLEKQIVAGRLHTSFNQHRTVTGRLSSNSPNLQNIPRGDLIRGTFVSDPDHVLVVGDYDQIELRCAAALSNDAEMIKVFQQNQDIHTQAASTMYQIAPEDVDAQQRQVGKTMNFGTLYGAGPRKVAAEAGVDVDTGIAFINRYYTQFSGLASWKAKVVGQAKRRGKDGKMPYAEIPPWGRKRRLPDLFSVDDEERKRAERQVVNAIVQGLASNIMKVAMIDLHPRLDGTPHLLLLNVHDELVLQSPVGQEDEGRQLLVEAMEGVQYNGGPILGAVPLTVDTGIGKSWSDCK